MTYQYKYNGKELQTELDLNTYAYGWRDYDPAIGRFNKMDRFSEKYYDKTQYGYAGNNPVLFVDVQGDSLSVANTQISKDYLNSAVNKSNQKYIKYDEKGNVSLDFGKVSDKAQKRLLKQDEGLAVINNMINATDVDGNSEKYYFEASNNREGIDGQGNEFSMEVTTVEGNSVSGLETTGYSWFANYSTTKYNDTVEHVTPKKGVDGAVFISPGTIYEYNNANIVIPMGGMIKHELRENYFRTHDKKGYNEAHKEAGGVSSFAKFKFD